MSNIYIQEPPTNGKVLLKTTIGDIDVELWSKEAPKACRNFVQLCMEGYYNNTIFHRIVKGFIAQGGDPTGTGAGGESIYGKPFKDEFHQRLKFNRRGLVAMANAGANDNGSQFFFTLDRADELNKKHTIFAKVGGNTIYNMIRFNDLDVDQDDRPYSPPKLIKTEVLYNPFDDIKPRAPKKIDNQEKEEKKKNKSKSKGTKNFKLLSFGEEAEEDEEKTNQFETEIKSSHDVLNDPKLSSQPAFEEGDAIDINTSISNSNKRTSKEQDIAESIRKKLKKDPAKQNHDVARDDSDDEDRKKKERRSKLKEEARKLKKEIKANSKSDKKEQEKDDQKELAMKKEVNDLMEQLVSEKKQFLKQKKEKIFKKGGDRESQTLALLSGFQSKLAELPDVEEEENWLTHKLNFEDSEEARDAKDANVKGDDWYDIYDPRNPINQRRRENSKKESKRKR